MPPRCRLNDLARLFDTSADPIYIVDRSRRIAYVNQACAAWTDRASEELVGRECRYRAADAADPIAAAADALCPPPAALAGRRVSAEIVLPTGTADVSSNIRRADFIPLGVAVEEAALVLVWLPADEIAARDRTEFLAHESEAERLHAIVAKVRRDAATRFAADRLLGDSPAMRRIRNQIAAAAATQATVSIVGPVGSGRKHLARAVHYHRHPTGEGAGPLVPLDGAVLGAELMQATIRGLARSAREAGRRAATLVVHDVDRLPADAQTELAGFFRLVDLPLRIITTSREPLARLVVANGFRADLAAWLSTLTIEIAPLASRPEDIPALAQRLLEDLNGRESKQLGGFSPEALDRLAGYAWPGETAELAQVVAQTHAAAEGPTVAVRDLPRRLLVAADAVRYAKPQDETIVLDEYLANVERELIRRAVERSKGNKTRAAERLGLTRPRLYRRMVQLGLEAEPIVFEELIDGEATE